jgi:hypothetical protein
MITKGDEMKKIFRNIVDAIVVRAACVLIGVSFIIASMFMPRRSLEALSGALREEFPKRKFSWI